jgi:hypothetical protein
MLRAAGKGNKMKTSGIQRLSYASPSTSIIRGLNAKLDPVQNSSWELSATQLFSTNLTDSNINFVRSVYA